MRGTLTAPSRRALLRVTACSAIILCLPDGRAFASELFDVLYFDWTTGIEAALDLLDTVKDAFPEPPAPLEVVRLGDRFAAVLRLGGSEAEAVAAAEAHSALLQEQTGSDEALAHAVVRSGYARVFNVSYGLGPHLDPLVASWTVVADRLGAGVARRLVVERTDHGNYALMYKRYGELEATRAAAARHGALLKGTNVQASFIQEQSFPIVYDGRSDDVAVPRGPAEAPAPPPAADADPLPLRDAINDTIQALRRTGQIAADERTAWLAWDLRADQQLAAINADQALQAASMIKPLVMLAFFHEVDRDRFVYGPKSRAKLEAMIQRSSNSATNWVIDQVGGPAAVQKLLDAHYGRLCQQTAVVERIAAGGRTYRNQASADDYGRYLRSLWSGDLPRAVEQLRLLGLPGRDRLYDGAPQIPVGTRVYNKTGSTARLCGDMGILMTRTPAGDPLPWIVVGIIEKAQRANPYGVWIAARANVIRAVSDLVYGFLKARYDLQQAPGP